MLLYREFFLMIWMWISLQLARNKERYDMWSFVIYLERRLVIYVWYKKPYDLGMCLIIYFSTRMFTKTDITFSLITFMSNEKIWRENGDPSVFHLSHLVSISHTFVLTKLSLRKIRTMSININETPCLSKTISWL